MDLRDIPQGKQIYQRILEDIQEGRLLPGHRLREAELALRMGHSRTPVREALRRLEAEGLVSHQARFGAVIRGLSPAEVTELYEMRIVLECTAARLAADAASRAEIEQLCQLNQAFGAEQNRAAAARLNRSFHDLLHTAARNRFLTSSLRGLQRSMYLLGPTMLGNAERSALAEAEHGQILDAIRQRDGAAAEAAMRRHMTAAQQTRLQSMQAALHPAAAATLSAAVRR